MAENSKIIQKDTMTASEIERTNQKILDILSRMGKDKEVQYAKELIENADNEFNRKKIFKEEQRIQLHDGRLLRINSKMLEVLKRIEEQLIDEQDTSIKYSDNSDKGGLEGFGIGFDKNGLPDIEGLKFKNWIENLLDYLLSGGYLSKKIYNHYKKKYKAEKTKLDSEINEDAKKKAKTDTVKEQKKIDSDRKKLDAEKEKLKKEQAKLDEEKKLLNETDQKKINETKADLDKQRADVEARQKQLKSEYKQLDKQQKNLNKQRKKIVKDYKLNQDLMKKPSVVKNAFKSTLRTAYNFTPLSDFEDVYRSTKNFFNKQNKIIETQNVANDVDTKLQNKDVKTPKVKSENPVKTTAELTDKQKIDELTKRGKFTPEEKKWFEKLSKPEKLTVKDKILMRGPKAKKFGAKLKVLNKIVSKGGKKLASLAAGPLAAVLIALQTVKDIWDGWNNAGELLNVDEEALTLGDKLSAAAGSVTSGVTFGLIDAGDVAKGVSRLSGTDDFQNLYADQLKLIQYHKIGNFDILNLEGIKQLTPAEIQSIIDLREWSDDDIQKLENAKAFAETETQQGLRQNVPKTVELLNAKIAETDENIVQLIGDDKELLNQYNNYKNTGDPKYAKFNFFKTPFGFTKKFNDYKALLVMRSRIANEESYYDSEGSKTFRDRLFRSGFAVEGSFGENDKIRDWEKIQELKGSDIQKLLNSMDLSDQDRMKMEQLRDISYQRGTGNSDEIDVKSIDKDTMFSMLEDEGIIEKVTEQYTQGYGYKVVKDNEFKEYLNNLSYNQLKDLFNWTLYQDPTGLSQRQTFGSEWDNYIKIRMNEQKEKESKTDVNINPLVALSDAIKGARDDFDKTMLDPNSSEAEKLQKKQIKERLEADRKAMLSVYSNDDSIEAQETKRLLSDDELEKRTTTDNTTLNDSAVLRNISESDAEIEQEKSSGAITQNAVENLDLSNVQPVNIDNNNGDLGSYVEKYESGKNRSAAIGYDGAGGTSYGSYQLASATGTLDRFLTFVEKVGGDFGKRLANDMRNAGPLNTGSTNGNAPAVWKKYSKEFGDSLEKLEHEFIYQTHYSPVLNAINANSAKNLIQTDRGLQEALWSSAVQHGQYASNIFNSTYRDGMSAKDWLIAIYNERSRPERFKKLRSSGVDGLRQYQNVKNRFKNELALVLGLSGGPQNAVTAVKNEVDTATAYDANASTDNNYSTQNSSQNAQIVQSEKNSINQETINALDAEQNTQKVDTATAYDAKSLIETSQNNKTETIIINEGNKSNLNISDSENLQSDKGIDNIQMERRKI